MVAPKLFLAVAAGTAVGAAVVYVVMSRRRVGAGEEDDDAFGGPIVADGGAATTGKVANASAEVDAVGSTASKGSTFRSLLATNGVDVGSVENKLLAEALNEIDVQAAVDQRPAQATGTKSSGALKGGEKEKDFPLLGLSMTLPPDWEVREDLSPFPNVAMLAVFNKDMDPQNAQQQQEAGSVPMIVMSVEDVRGDNVDLLEFKERCKELAVNQMLMMTGGAIQPLISKDTTVLEGPFRYALEYAQSLPPLYEIKVLNLMEVRNSIAYTFQIMCAPNIMPKFKPVFMKIAQGMRIKENIDTALGYVKLHTGTVKVDIDTSWGWEYPGKHGALVTFTTTSTFKKEEISLYAQDAVPKSAYIPREKKTIDGVVVVSAYDGAQQQKTFTCNGYTLVAKPLQKTFSCLAEKDLVAVVKSVAPSMLPPRPKKGGTFVNAVHGYQVDIAGGSRLVASRIGGGSVAYAPATTDVAASDEQPPAVTIRVGSPKNDPDCMGSLEEWMERMKREAAEGGIRDIKRTTINGEPCLTFTSQNMEEVAPGQRMEVYGKVFIFVRDGKTTLLRWEMATGLWRKFEREMNAFVESLQFI
ncbi:putative dynamin-like protein [Trypanosoma rangeli]|uniref:Putative dynamin-like protein n=1 Tax=Trypanosoma rangeli TaxID=5698 RepID=A0A3R7MXK0_TRYRA|nr:putative dynamin-like protein [Trypanosoma rangeli]RNE96833.1 putative dynamin-like protein [Trypanosoma rangeli]|eukprot:RNE96833.1 putative dynamin-like protein [Trypanosoma rangeli]